MRKEEGINGRRRARRGFPGIGSVLKSIQRAHGRSMLRDARKHSVHGITLAVGSALSIEDAFVGKCERALALIKAHDPRRFTRLRRDLEVIFLSAGGGPYYDEGIEGFVIDAASLGAATELRLASMIVHEAIHARLQRVGVGIDRKDTARREALCIRAEIDFLRRVPNSEDLIRRLEHALENPWWTEADRERRIKRFVEGYSLPAWVGKLLLIVGRRWA